MRHSIASIRAPRPRRSSPGHPAPVPRTTRTPRTDRTVRVDERATHHRLPETTPTRSTRRTVHRVPDRSGRSIRDMSFRHGPVSRGNNRSVMCNGCCFLPTLMIAICPHAARFPQGSVTCVCGLCRTTRDGDLRQPTPSHAMCTVAVAWRTTRVAWITICPMCLFPLDLQPASIEHSPSLSTGKSL